MQKKDAQWLSALIVSVIAVIIIMLLIPVIVAYAGLYNFAATKKHTAMTLWLIDTAQEHSIGRMAQSVELPDLQKQEMIRKGFEHYSEMCQLCHGGPGVNRDEFAVGLYPEPPDMKEIKDDWSNEEIFWIVKNGMKMSGMPAFSETHSDDELLVMIAFVNYLPQMSADEYKRWLQERSTAHEK